VVDEVERGSEALKIAAGGTEQRPAESADAAGHLVLVHPRLGADALGRFLPALWPAADAGRVPEGYAEITAAFCGPRAFCSAGLERQVPPPDPELPARVRSWIDELAGRWRLAETFTIREFGIWCFLRDRMARWLHARMVERRVIEALAAQGPLTVTAAGVGDDQRALLRVLADALGDALRPETAVLPPPARRAAETVTERRLRKLFALLQDGWHGIQLLVEDLFVRRPKVLFVSSSQCWQRHGINGGRGRRDAHLGDVWRQGRRRPWRLYYRTDRYDPEVGAMTSGRLAPTYLRHFLFLLAQTSRGFWEVRGIQKQWRALREERGFREALVFEGLDISELVLDWFDEAVNRRLPVDVRTTRRETHFLRGIRPDAILLAQSHEENRPLISAARRLGIPTAALQLRPFHDWDHTCLHSRAARCTAVGLPDRLCVFSREVKSFLVGEGSLDPSSVVVTGDPRRTAGAPEAGADAAESDAAGRRRAMRARWGVEEGQRVLGVACLPAHAPQLLAWIERAISGRTDTFVLFHPSAEVGGDQRAYQGYLRSGELRWFHVDSQDRFAGWIEGIDLLVATTWAEACEGALHGAATLLVDLGERPRFSGPDPDALLRRVADPEALAAEIERLLAAPPARRPAESAAVAFAEAVFGPAQGDAAGKILQAVGELLAERRP
jgi:hypothetical protein